ncbi:transferrin receptor protein 2 isoform X4 [Strigops habroptila]|uniref:transferrin receptor protein 2 isoform X4 n=1 Tax=Strigops habroptila TaxID=2489341 RepID=UPI0011CF73D3|nr:transferrin receptor protein 2 isoform X4 [Strigops habroptila]
MGGGRELERLRLDPEAFCAWSAPGNATGGLVYGHYGRPQDLALLRARGVPPRGNLLLLRLGRGPPGAKVAAAAGVGAVGVLLYPDPQDTAGPGGDPGLGGDTAVTVHLQEGSGDPYSRGFPSFTGRAPPGPPPGVPPIPAHPISANTAARLLRVLGGPRAPARWGVPSRGLWYRPGPGGRRLRLSVAAGTAPGTLTSVFGALEGRLEPDCYIIVGAQRDSLGPGAAASGVGTALLLELARLFAAMGRDGFQLRRTLLFVSWDGAEFGHLGATEWLEGYPDLLHTKAAAYISLDQAVLGADRLVVKTSPTLVNLIESALSQVESPNEGGKSLLEQVTRPGRGWESDVIRPLPPESGAFPFTAAAGVPALELGFEECLSSARGDVVRAAERLRQDMAGSEATNERLNRGFNARIMAAEASLLSPFVSPLVTPFRHVLLGRGDHTLPALAAQLGTRGDSSHLRLRLALLAWTLQGTAGALAGDAWDRGDIGDRGGLGDIGERGDNGSTGGLGDTGGYGDYGDTWVDGGLGDNSDAWDHGGTWSYGDTWDDGDHGDDGDTWVDGGLGDPMGTAGPP